MSDIDPAVLADQAESYAVGDAMPDFRHRLDSYLHRVDGNGWTRATSQLLDPNGEYPGRNVAWWLLENGATVTGFQVPTGHASEAIAARTTASPATVPEGGIVDVLAYDDGMCFVQVLEDVEELDLSALPEAKLTPLSSLPHGNMFVYLAEKAQCFEIEATRDPDEELVERPMDYFRVRESSAVDPSDDFAEASLDAIPPCIGACIGTATMVLFSEQRKTTGFSPQPSSETRSQVKDRLSIRDLGQAEKLSASSGHISKMNWGGNRYLYLNPSGIVLAAGLHHRFGKDVLTKDVLSMLRNWRSQISSVVGKLDRAAKWARLNKGILPPVFEESPDEWRPISE